MKEKNEKPLISVLIPAYNVEKYLARCLDSVLGQTYQNVEVIVVDDGSTDATGEVCKAYHQKDARVQVITQENAGVSVARNRALDCAKGTYLFFLDSDDWILEDALASLMQLMEQEDADIVACGVSLCYEDGRRESFSENANYTVSGKEAVSIMIKEATICSLVTNKLYRKDVWNDVRFPIGKIHEDEYATYQTLYAAKRVVYTPEQYYQYFQRRTGIMGSMFLKGEIDKLDALWKRTEWLEEKKETTLVDVSLEEYLNYVKYIFRRYESEIGKEAYIVLSDAFCRGMQKAKERGSFSGMKKWKNQIWYKRIRGMRF